MTKINLQFHALPIQIVEFAEDCAREYGFSLVAMTFFPDFKAIFIEEYNIKSYIRNIEKIDRICLCKDKPDISANSPIDFLDKNPYTMVINIGKLDTNGLGESVLSAQTDNSELLKLWRKIVKKLNSIMKKGAWVENPNTGSKAFYKNHCYTNEAKELYESGVRILPVAGWNYYILDNNES